MPYLLPTLLPLSPPFYLQAAKSAVTQLFETMRAEPIGADVSITVAFPGATATEMTAGKTLDERGRMVVDADRRDVSEEGRSVCASLSEVAFLHAFMYCCVSHHIYL